jgi:hypothetical protein
MTEPLKREELLRRQLEKARMELADQRSLNKRLMRNQGVSFEQVIEELRNCANSPEPFQITPVPVSKLKAKSIPPVSAGHSETATCILSDWHTSEVVREEESNGINAYNSMILSNRVWELVQTIKQILGLHLTMYKLDKIWLPILGDMINGSIHPELALTNDLTDPAATVLAARLLQMLIVELKVLGLPIEIDCVVGNHPRLLAKMPTKRQAHLSFDWIVYEMLADMFKGDDQIKITIHTGQLGIVEQYGHRFVVEHGIDVSSGKEEQIEDRLRALFDDPVYRKATGLKGSAFDMILQGNMHKPKMLERTIINGCLTGQNELGMGWRLKPIKCIQQMFGISEGHVTTWHYPVDVTSVKSDKAQNPFSDYTRWYMKRHGR